ncbi:hypothetical protein OS493_020851 [Desmophyllum pertusum]|uniref:Uncharacterized protein n=1 Tax=Desmophyllum pertusum TaxID=174260 RepID=A0A9X0CEG7_9CNID|nr:hypothetical protein OS493_020851 [Desmophyllum pertusum]
MIVNLEAQDITAEVVPTLSDAQLVQHGKAVLAMNNNSPAAVANVISEARTLVQTLQPPTELVAEQFTQDFAKQEDMDTSEEEEQYLIEVATKNVADSVPAEKTTMSSEDECVEELSKSSKKSKAKPNGKAKKRKQPKAKAAADKMENFMENFFHLQQESERQFLEYEERRAKQEAEQEEKRCQFEAEQDSK